MSSPESPPIPQLPNPLTPLAWLPPDIANQFHNARLIGAIALGLWGWDVLMSLGDEYRIFRKKFKLPDVAYILARITSGTFIIMAFIFNNFDLNDCESYVKGIGSFASLGILFNSTLFLYRILAIFHGRRLIISFFVFLWIGTFACSLTAPFSLGGTHIGTTKLCIPYRVKSYGTAGIVASGVNDTLVFIAITFHLLSGMPVKGLSGRVKNFFSGAGMGRLSRAILHDGQKYYLVVVSINIIATVMILTPSVPLAYANIMAIVNAALQNSMACRVFRDLKLGYYKSMNPTQHSARTQPIDFVFGTQGDASNFHEGQRASNPPESSVGAQSQKDAYDMGSHSEKGEIAEVEYRSSKGPVDMV
ncbi:hypothetical protein BXZ70DRAFT_57653 [Cristinia sonorae]|uniref:Uncharacterized protein n=1 Tax=Cristinia sonorae TaxID=1940300 RepID=A0A8K0UR22_9AGAR|nr:hypothetical protein BXZ70DRAFT_57653 [Cristinia sonorae]